MELENNSCSDKNPENVSFTTLQINDSFTHYRSVSYFEAIASISTSASYKSRLNVMSASDQHLKQQNRLSSCSTPCTPKKIEIEKYSTLPVTGFFSVKDCSSKKSRSSSLSNFFSKFKPKFHRSANDMKNPWIVIEFSPNDKDDISYDGSEHSDHSFELAAKTKEAHFTSLKDLHDSCKCSLSSGNQHRKMNLSTSDFLNPHCVSKSTIKSNTKNAKYTSENSIFFRLSPRRRFEHFKHALKSLTSKHKCKKCSRPNWLESKKAQSKSEVCLKFGRNSLPRDSSSFISQIETRSPSVLHHSSGTTSTKALACSIANSLKVPLSQSANAKLSSAAESSPRPESLNISSKGLFGVSECARVKMASVESIGTCSIDFDASEMSDTYGANHVTASEFTLRSTHLVPSINGVHSVKDKVDVEKSDRNAVKLTNGHEGKEIKEECTVAEIKLPSYVSISCAINGYTNYSQFCRSRDNSPARITFRKSSLEANFSYDSNSKNGNNRLSAPNFRCTRSLSDCNGNVQSLYTESHQVNISKHLQIPLASSKKYTTEIIINNGQSPVKSLRNSLSSANGQLVEEFPLAKEIGNGTKSLVQQRIESLYGGSALEKAKLSCRTSRINNPQTNRNLASSVIAKRSPSCPPQIAKNPIDNNLPVFRHLAKDFREQLLFDDASQSIQFGKTKSLKIYPVLTGKKNVIDPKIANSVDEIEVQEFYSLPNGVGMDECDKVLPGPSYVKMASSEVSPKSKTNSPFLSEENNGQTFLNMMESEKKAIQNEIIKWEAELIENLPEDASGKIRAACGKANLLLSQKFEQFRGLCHRNIEEGKDDPFYTTASDLAGFWDMVLLQVKDVKSTFNDIQVMKENDWQEASPKKITVAQQRTKKFHPSVVSKSNPCTPKRSAKSIELAKAREEARKQLIAAKKRARQQNIGTDDSEVSIYTPQNCS